MPRPHKFARPKHLYHALFNHDDDAIITIMAHLNKIAATSPSRQRPSELETDISKALYDLESNIPDMKTALRPLQFASAREVSRDNSISILPNGWQLVSGVINLNITCSLHLTIETFNSTITCNMKANHSLLYSSKSATAKKRSSSSSLFPFFPASTKSNNGNYLLSSCLLFSSTHTDSSQA